MRQIPRGPDNLKCPLWQDIMENVCHKCPWWQQIRGKHPQSTEEVDKWDCAVSFLPMLLIENAQRQMQTAASVDKVANEVQKSAGVAAVSSLADLLGRTAINADTTKLIGHG